MELLDLARIAAQYATDIAHAMMHAVAVAVAEGSMYGWLEEAPGIQASGGMKPRG